MRICLSQKTFVLRLSSFFVSVCARRPLTDSPGIFFISRQGYRARSAYKLAQLNRKFDFLSKAKAVIDLCAAPGGWLQVCSEVMPANSIILGMDLVPILPIPNVKTHICDITTEEARSILRKDLQGWKADVVLNDGAPNVGGAYSKDAFVQNHLCLKALHLAADTLRQGGTFVTKVFRSQDYVALLWVFKQLFKYCKATKPTSSRMESAEIFVVCQGFLAPSSIDPKIFDPRYVFEQLDGPKQQLNVFHPKWGQQRRHRSGYADELGMSLRKKITVSQFVSSKEPIDLLSGADVIEWDEDADVFKSQKATTPEIKACMEDLKVLGKSEFSALVKWRLKMKKYKESLEKEAAGDHDEDSDEDMVDEDMVDEEKPVEDEYAKLQREEVDMRLRAQAANKRDKKKERRERARRMQRIALGIDTNEAETVNAADAQEQVFSLASLKNQEALDAIHEEVDPLHGVVGSDDGESESDDESDMEDSASDEDKDYEAELENSLDAMYEQYAVESRNKKKERLQQAQNARLIKKARRDALGQENMMEVMKEMDTDMANYVSLLNNKNPEAKGKSSKKKKRRKDDDEDDSDLDVDR
jgi:AdoMet-dependent rRNA methyltransferase SPB1